MHIRPLLSLGGFVEIRFIILTCSLGREVGHGSTPRIFYEDPSSVTQQIESVFWCPTQIPCETCVLVFVFPTTTLFVLDIPSIYNVKQRTAPHFEIKFDWMAFVNDNLLYYSTVMRRKSDLSVFLGNVVHIKTLWTWKKRPVRGLRLHELVVFRFICYRSFLLNEYCSS